MKMQPEEKDQPIAKEESYIQRRMLFKDIWETAMYIHEKDEVINKRKIIKTLRLDDMDKCVVGKTKKQRVKNLRHVCKKILDFCDRQDADDKFYEQLAATEGRGQIKVVHKIDLKRPKKKKHKKNIRSISQTADKDKKKRKRKVKRYPSPVSEKRKTFGNRKTKQVKPKFSPAKEVQAPSQAPSSVKAGSTSIELPANHPSVTCRKCIKKIYSINKKPLDPAVHTVVRKATADLLTRRESISKSLIIIGEPKSVEFARQNWSDPGNIL